MKIREDMKILYILNEAKRLNNFSYTSMIAAKKVGLEFQIAGKWGYINSLEKKTDEQTYDIKIHQVNFIRTPYDLRNIKAFKQIVKIIKDEKIDIIHCNTPIGGVIGRLAGNKCKVNTIIYQAHGFHFYKGSSIFNWILFYPVEKWLTRYTDILITINSEDYQISKKLRTDNNIKLFYIPGVGINVNKYSSDLQLRKETRLKLGFTSNDVLLISIGEINKNKNNKIILEAISKMNKRNVHYLLCGIGDQKEYLEKLAKKLSIEKNVHFLGYQNNVVDLLNASDIFVLPSFREGLSRSLMEAMAIGLPCIVSNIRGNRDLIEDNVQGYLCNPCDINSFYNKIEHLVSNPIIRKQMSMEASKKIQKFKNEIVIEKFEYIYRNIVNTKNN